LGIDLDKDTLKKYMRQVRRRSNQNWAIFLRNHAHEVWACDFTVVHDLLFRPLYIFVIIAHKTRQIIHFAVTRHPTDAWVAQQLREATPWGRRPRFLIRDNDKKYGECFAAVARSSGIKVLKTPILAPRANAICERFIGSLKREALDFFIILHQRHIHRVVFEYADYFNRERAHQGIGQRIPTQFNAPRPPLSKEVKGKVISTPVLRGLHHSYAYASAWQ
jgi:putative transposase